MSAKSSLHPPQFTWQWACTPLGLWFIHTDEGLAGLCRLRMRMKERAMAVGSTATLTRLRWSLEGLEGHHCPPGMQHSQSHPKHPASSSALICLLLSLPFLSFWKGEREGYLFYFIRSHWAFGREGKCMWEEGRRGPGMAVTRDRANGWGIW